MSESFIRECSGSFARSVQVHQHEWTWPLRRPRLRKKIRSVSNTLNTFHRAMIHSLMRRARPIVHRRFSRSTSASKRGPVQNGHPRWSRSTNYAPVSAKIQRAPTQNRAWGKSCKLLGEPALPVFACVSLVCSCLLRCLAVLPLSLCPLALSSISSRLTGTVRRTGNIFGQSTGVLYIWPVRNFRKDGARRKCRSTMKIQ